MNLNSFLDDVRELRFSWKEEIPDRLIRGDDSDNHYKVRNNWFQSVYGILIIGKGEGFISDDDFHDLDKIFNARFGNGTGFHDRRTTKEDIAYANAILDMVISICSKIKQ